MKYDVHLKWRGKVYGMNGKVYGKSKTDKHTLETGTWGIL